MFSHTAHRRGLSALLLLAGAVLVPGLVWAADDKPPTAGSVLDQDNLRMYLKFGGGLLLDTGINKPPNGQLGWAADHSDDVTYKSFPIKSASATFGFEPTASESGGILSDWRYEVAYRSIRPFIVTNWHPDGTAAANQTPVDTTTTGRMIAVSVAQHIVSPSRWYRGFSVGVGNISLSTSSVGSSSGTGAYLTADVGYQISRRWGVELLVGGMFTKKVQVPSGDKILKYPSATSLVTTELTLVGRF